VATAADPGRGAARPRRAAGLTYVELLVTCAVLAILAAATIPVAKTALKREREVELRQALRQIRTAIDQYKTYCDSGLIIKEGVDSECYPPDLDTLVKGVSQVGTIDKKLKFLRRIPKDPFTGKPEWGLRSYQDEADARSWGRQNVWDVYTEFDGTGLDGTKYSTW
jgi:general secretion pathway protein G